MTVGADCRYIGRVEETGGINARACEVMHHFGGVHTLAAVDEVLADRIQRDYCFCEPQPALCPVQLVNGVIGVGLGVVGLMLLLDVVFTTSTPANLTRCGRSVRH
jgi:hypothetical protein